MLEKTPKRSPLFTKAIKWVVAGELILIGISYGFYTYLNRNREFRLQVYKEYPIVVDYYYKIGETLNSDYKGREIDQAIWTQEKKI